MKNNTLQINIVEEVKVSDVVLSIDKFKPFVVLLFAMPKEELVVIRNGNLPFKIRPPNSLTYYDASCQDFRNPEKCHYGRTLKIC
jgi:hypothetical protein